MVGEPVEIAIEALIWDEEIERHFARHLVNHGNVMAVLDSDPITHENLPGRSGTHVMIGPDDSGRILYVSIKPTDMPNVWEPVTGWQSRLARRLWLRERGH